MNATERMCLGVIEGISDYTQHRTDWRFGLLGRHPTQPVRPPRADGVIGILSDKLVDQWAEEFRGFAVNVSRGYHREGIACVTCDDRLIGAMAAEYLIGKGLRRFGYVGPRSERGSAFVRRLEAEGHSCSYLEEGAPPPEDVDGWLASLPRHVGILAFNDGIARYLLLRARSVGRAVPENLAVVGVDDDRLESLLAPMTITSIEADFPTVGHRAASLLERAFEGEDIRDQCIRIPPLGVVERQSSDYVGIGDEIVVRAGRYIQRYACAGIRPADVIEAVPLSRRPLERRFRSLLGRTLMQEINRVRVSEAARLLVRTDSPVAIIAEESGFSSREWFTKVFGEAMGVSPVAYRRRHSPKT